MARLPVLAFRDVDRALVRLGFVAVRQRGSHACYRHDDGRTTTVPHHGGRDVAPSPMTRTLEGVDRTLRRAGFAAVPAWTSHVFSLRDDESTTMPHHGASQVAPCLLTKILEDVGVSAAQFMEVLRS